MLVTVLEVPRSAVVDATPAERHDFMHQLRTIFNCDIFEDYFVSRLGCVSLSVEERDYANLVRRHNYEPTVYRVFLGGSSFAVQIFPDRYAPTFIHTQPTAKASPSKTLLLLNH